MGTPIPELRDQLMEIADQLEQPLLFPVPLAEQAAMIRHIVSEMWREPAVTNAPVVSMPMTPERAEQIRKYHAEHPELTQEQIGRRFNVAGGRVSEALNLKR